MLLNATNGGEVYIQHTFAGETVKTENLLIKLPWIAHVLLFAQLSVRDAAAIFSVAFFLPQVMTSGQLKKDF